MSGKQISTTCAVITINNIVGDLFVDLVKTVDLQRGGWVWACESGLRTTPTPSWSVNVQKTHARNKINAIKCCWNLEESGTFLLLLLLFYNN